MKLLLDSSVWIGILRGDRLPEALARIRGRHQLWMDAFVAAELFAGCRSRSERKQVSILVAPFARAARLRAATANDMIGAGRALSMLRQRGIQLANPAGALIDAGIAIGAVRLGALLVTDNVRDFRKLSAVLPLSWTTRAEFLD